MEQQLTMKIIWFVLALSTLATAQIQVNTVDFCDKQADLVQAMKPMIDEVAKNIVTPAYKTPADVSNFLQMALSFGLGSRCSWLRANDRLVMAEARLQADESKLATLQANFQPAINAAADVAALAIRVKALEDKVAALPASTDPTTITAINAQIDFIRQTIANLQSQVKVAGTALAR